MATFLLLIFYCSLPTQGQSLLSVDINGNNNTVVQVIIELSHGDPDWLNKNEGRVTKLAERLGVSNALLANFLAKIDQGEVARDRWPELLARVASEYTLYKERLEVLEAEDPNGLTTVARAAEALDRADFETADRLLLEAQEQTTAARKREKERFIKQATLEVKVISLRASAQKVRLQYLNAAKVYEEAATAAEENVGRELRDEMMDLAADAYYRAGLENGDRVSLAKAAKHFAERAKSEEGFGVSHSQASVYYFGLANALYATGRLEHGSETLEEALHAYEQVVERTPKQTVPLAWVVAQENIAAVSAEIGIRDGDVT